MKLNKTELSALAERISGNLEKAAVEAQEECDAVNAARNKETAERVIKELRNASRTISKALDRLSPEARKMVSSSHRSLALPDPTLKTAIDYVRVKQTKIKPSCDYRSGYPEIFNDLVIAQIDAASVDELVKKIMDRYTT